MRRSALPLALALLLTTPGCFTIAFGTVGQRTGKNADRERQQVRPVLLDDLSVLPPRTPIVLSTAGGLRYQATAGEITVTPDSLWIDRSARLARADVAEITSLRFTSGFGGRSGVFGVLLGLTLDVLLVIDYNERNRRDGN